MKTKRVRGNYVLIEPDVKEEVTVSGITLAKKPEQGDLSVGTIKSVGTGKRVENDPQGSYIALDLSVGDRVLFQYGYKVQIDDTFLLLVDETDVKIVLE